MKRKRFSGFVICLIMLFALTTPAFAAQTQYITVDPIHVMVGGKDFLPTNVNGKGVPVFVYKGTTYAPLRALAEAYGLTVGYDQEKRLATVDFVSTEGIDFTALLEAVSAAREAEIKSPTSFTGYTDYLVNDPATKNLLTEEEVNALLHTRDQTVRGVSVGEAVSDIDLLFRALHVGYGAYYYFGQEAFDRAEAEVMDWLNGQTTVSVDELTDVLRRSLSFMVDAHSYVGRRIDVLEGVRYKYHSCTGRPAPPAVSGSSFFRDVPEDSYYAGAVDWAAENSITDGTGGGKFSPDAECTRGQIVTFLFRWMAE